MAWSVPLLTSIGLLGTLGGVISLQKLGLDATANLVTVVSAIAGAMCNTGQWVATIAAARTDSTPTAVPEPAAQEQTAQPPSFQPQPV